MVLIAPGLAQAEWVAYIDHARGPQTAANVTALDLSLVDVVYLTNITTGATLPARMEIGRTGTASTSGTMGAPNNGTPAYNLFQGYIDWMTSPSNNNGVLLYGPLSGYPNGVYTLTFTNLDPGKRYTFKGSAVRGGTSSYSNRWTFCVIQGADGFTGAHTSGCITNGDPRVPAGTITNGQVAFCAGINFTGDMVAWDDISPGSDGTFSIQMQQWMGAIPGGTAGNNYGYALEAMRLEEYSYAAPPQITAPMQDQSSAPGAQVTFTVGAVGSSPMRYFWYSNTVFVAVNDTGVFTSTIYRLASNYVCRVVVSNVFGMATNSAVAYGVIPNPSVTLTAPVPGQQYGAPATVSVQATASAGTGATVRGVGFFTSGGLNLGGAATQPYGVTASLPAVGTYGIYAVVTNSFGLTAYSQTNVIAVVAAIDAIIYSGGTYSQNFNTMGSAGTSTPFGWYVGAAAGAQGEVSSTNVTVGDGTTSLVASYNLGASGGADRALGSQAGTAAGGDLVTEVRISNNTGSNMLAFGISYDGEQWRANSVSEAPQMLDMYYSIDGSVFVPMPSSFSFTSRVDIGAAALNGNLAANRRAGIGGVYTPAVPVPPGGVVYLRWLDINNGGNDHQLAIDNFSFIAANPVARVEITSPAAGTGYDSPATIPIAATTSGFVRAVTNMDFYAGSTYLGRTTAAPYVFTWNNAPNGNYALRSVATDSGGLRVTSAPVNVSVTTPVLVGIPLGQTYSFASAPPASDWSTYSVAGSGPTAPDPAGLDAIATNMDASTISAALVTASAYTSDALASWNAAAGTVFTRPTGNGVTLMMATLRNSTGGFVPALNISYNFGGASTTAEEIEGLRAYYSLTGQSGKLDGDSGIFDEWRGSAQRIGDFGCMGAKRAPVFDVGG